MNEPHTELPHERHNRLAIEIGTRILTEFPETEDRMVLLGSIAKGVICMITSKSEERQVLAEILAEDLQERIAEEANRKSQL